MDYETIFKTIALVAIVFWLLFVLAYLFYSEKFIRAFAAFKREPTKEEPKIVFQTLHPIVLRSQRVIAVREFHNQDHHLFEIQKQKFELLKEAEKFIKVNSYDRMGSFPYSMDEKQIEMELTIYQKPN